MALPGECATIGKAYKGGMKIAEIDADGVAYLCGMRRDDIIVGIHEWETTDASDFDYVVRRISDEQVNARFYLLRNGTMRVGEFTID